ncbi:MAG TPA: hypothetical protein VLM85_29065, partial [Polyangiaceae bacterium]|nr:hypothetical protein [Polyangiaceae bacterium]
MNRLALGAVVVTSSLIVVACGSAPDNFGLSSQSSSQGLSGCHGKASSSQPSDGQYYLTSFGNSPSDNGQMSCGQYTKNGSWYYAASRQRFGCGSHIQIEANGNCVVAETDDYGPDVCVENAAGRPIIDASPLVSQALFGTKSAGWSDRYSITVTEVSGSTPLGPCTGNGNNNNSNNNTTTTSSGADCASSTLDMNVPSGTCLQSAGDAAWYHCVDGTWESGQTGCTTSYAWC